MSRTASVHRVTSESDVQVSLDLDGTGVSRISTGVGFYDHMLTALSRHSLIDLDVTTSGDTWVDGHHGVEDTAIAIGRGLREALAQAVVDVAGRPYAVCSGEPESQVTARIGGDGVLYPGSMTYHVMEALALNAGVCLHLRLLAGREPHHIVEAQFKALARALRAAVEPDPRVEGVPSTKGLL